MLIFLLFHTLSSSRQRAIQMAKAMTKELRDSQAKLQQSHHKLRQLAAHGDQIKEEERKRIAREIHDDLGQNLLVLRGGTVGEQPLEERDLAQHRHALFAGGFAGEGLAADEQGGAIGQLGQAN